MARPLLLDLFCGAGGAAMGYYRAGFDVVGVDIKPQPRYPFEFHQTDALIFLKYLRHHERRFMAIHASPPCQAYSKSQKIRGNTHPDLIDRLRELLNMVGLTWVIENVEGAPLRNPLLLCGRSFNGLRVYRHRLFETTFPKWAPPHEDHDHPLAKMGRPVGPNEFMHVVGNFSDVETARQAMGIDWMTRDELREAIPPAYTELIGRQLMASVAVPGSPSA